jgi:molybdate transport system substrate-binding protein
MEDTLAKLAVMCARSMHGAVGALGRAFAEENGHELAFDFGTVGALQEKLNAGARADVLILSAAMIDKLSDAGTVIAGSVRNVARTFIAVCIRDGSPVPDFSTPDAFKQMLENARAVAMSDPAVGGSAAVYLPVVLERLGIAEAMKPKSLLEKNGVEVARRVVEGKAEFGLTLSGEIASVEGAAIAGPLPPPLGQDTVYAAAVMAGSVAEDAARDFISTLTAPEARATWQKAGFEVP